VSRAFEPGDLCLLVDGRGRTYLFDLVAGSAFQYHAGSLDHDAIIGREPTCVLRSSTGSRLVAMRPRLADYLLRMPRGAQLVYPKDLGPMIHWGDVRPGDTVIEAGTGSGALTLALLRAVGDTGHVVTVERRDDHRDHARGVIERFLGGLPPNLEMIDGDVVDVVSSRPGADRLVLDLPEPWLAVDAAAGRLAGDAIVCAYVPTVPQVRRLVDAMRRTGRFIPAETFEGMHREWKVDGRAVRPQSQMVGHTGFITVGHHTSEPLDADDPTEQVGSSDQNGGAG
jgi:tRNA (adenine57-N1/adenine58-N1)-methyltransferase